MSGVLGIVACGVVLSYYGKPRVSSPVLPSLMDFWKTLQFFADTTIFFLSGMVSLPLLMWSTSLLWSSVLFVSLALALSMMSLLLLQLERCSAQRVHVHSTSGRTIVSLQRCQCASVWLPVHIVIVVWS